MATTLPIGEIGFGGARPSAKAEGILGLFRSETSRVPRSPARADTAPEITLRETVAPRVKVLSSTSEMFPLIKTGGLADVTGALPKAMLSLGVETRTILPLYPSLEHLKAEFRQIATLTVLGETASIWSGRHDDLDLLLLDCPTLFDRAGGPYLDENGNDHADNWKRFAALSQATAKIAGGCLDSWRPDLLHIHDWQTALAAAYVRAMDLNIPTILTIHNLAFQGQYPTALFGQLELPASFAGTENLEYYGDMSYLKAGIAASNIVTTVSPTYAREILTDQLGMGMEGVLFTRRDALRGIVNGIDQNVWNPLTDPHLPVNYDNRNVAKRRANRRVLENRFGLEESSGPIISVISRLTWQKGIDLITPILPGIVDRGARLIVYGQGDPAIIHPLMEQAWRYPGKVVVHVGFSEADAHLLHGGSDIVLQPSRFEPCGLTQLYALRYGAIPIVARTGGLAETIIDANEAAMAAGAATGFLFQPGSMEDLYHAVDRALQAYEQPSFWRRLQSQGMKADFGWNRSAEQYARLYQRLMM